MRNLGHMKKFVEADPVVMSGASQGETVDNPSDETFTETELSLTLNPVTSVTPSPVKLSMDSSRAPRQKSAPSGYMTLSFNALIRYGQMSALICL